MIRKTLSFPPELWARVEEYAHLHRMKRDAAVMRVITEAGLAVLEKADARKAGVRRGKEADADADAAAAPAARARKGSGA